VDVQKSCFDDDELRCSVFDVEYGVQPKTLVLTYQYCTLHSSLSIKTPAELTISKATLLTKEGSSVEMVKRSAEYGELTKDPSQGLILKRHQRS